jgi:hypothetical protein
MTLVPPALCRKECSCWSLFLGMVVMCDGSYCSRSLLCLKLLPGQGLNIQVVYFFLTNLFHKAWTGFAIAHHWSLVFGGLFY